MKVYSQSESAVSPRGNGSLVCYGDLVQLFASLPSARAEACGGEERGVSVPEATAQRELARALGFEYCPLPSGPDDRGTQEKDVTPEGINEAGDHLVPRPRPVNTELSQVTEGWPEQRQPTMLWQVQSRTIVADLSGDRHGRRKRSPGPKAERRELKWRGQPEDHLPWRPLAPWSVVETRLRRMLTGEATGRELDVPAVSRWLAELRIDRPIPRRAVTRWGCDVQVLVDSSEHLQPYFQDQQMVLSRLQKLLGLREEQVFFGTDPGNTRNGSDFCRWTSDTTREGWRMPPAGTRVLILGDLGVLGPWQPEISARWLRLGQQLRRRQCLPMALLPCNLQTLAERLSQSPDLARDLRRAMQINSWTAEQPAPQNGEARRKLVDRLAGCLSYTIRIEPQLMRSVRMLLPLAGDPGLEAELWRHPLLAGHSSVAATPRAGEPAETLLAQFEQEDEAFRRSVLSVWRSHRSRTRPEIYLEELGRLTKASIGLCPPADYEDAIAAWRYFEHLAASERTPGTNLYVQYADRAIRRAVGELNVNSPVAEMIGKIRNHLRKEKGQREQQAGDRIEIYQSGRHLIFRSVDESQPEPERLLRHSLLAALRCGSDSIRVLSGAGKFEETKRVPLGEPVTCRTPEAATLEIRTDQEQIRLEQAPRPSWAASFGRDEYGLWADTDVRGVRVRWRWIPAGEFWMGSPEDEPGRDEDEGPRHRVRLTRGYWMMETACTQLFWESVLGTESNRSRFRDPMRPVENVSWDDVQVFVKELEALVPGFGVSLPTEAQWEYACRAGSSEALYRIPGTTGALKIVGLNNGPALDAIAWYGGNSGLDFKLTNGVDTAGWREKQYPESTAGTHGVGEKSPNAWGLYDMLGNVWEWCLDGPREYKSGIEKDPEGPQVKLRVIRGGSWSDGARGARCGDRHWRSQTEIRDGQGFRLTRPGE